MFFPSVCASQNCKCTKTTTAALGGRECSVLILGRRRTASSEYTAILMSGRNVTNRQQIQILPSLRKPRGNNVS